MKTHHYVIVGGLILAAFAGGALAAAFSGIPAVGKLGQSSAVGDAITKLIS